MAHISKSEPTDCCVLVRHLHGRNPHREGEVGLMVQAVILGPIHFVAGADVQHISALYHREAPGMKGRHRVGSQKPGVVHPLPVLAIPDHPDDLSAVVFLRVFLAKHQKIVLLSRVKSPKQRQLHRQILLGQNIPGPVVSFHRDFLACILHFGSSRRSLPPSGKNTPAGPHSPGSRACLHCPKGPARDLLPRCSRKGSPTGAPPK